MVVLASMMFVPIAVSGAAAPPASQSLCYAKTKDWRAWVERSTKSRHPELVVSGIVTTPTGSNRRYLTLGPRTKHKPTQQIINLEIKAISEIATLAVVTEEVRGRFAAAPRYGSIVIQCNGQEVGRVLPVRHVP